MKKFLLYNDIVIRAGISHTLWCYNYAIQLAQLKNLQLIVPKIELGHNLGYDFSFEKFFGLDIFDNNFIKNLNKDEVLLVQRNSNISSSDFSNTKNFFCDRYFNSSKEHIFNNHIVKDKITISINIRRGDFLQKIDSYKYWLVPDEWFRKCLDYVLKNYKLTLNDIHVNLYSETYNGCYRNELGQQTNLNDIFNFNNFSLYLDSNPYESFYNMVNSDIFIGGSARGFSHSVPLFRDSIKKMSFVREESKNFFDRNDLKFSNAVDNKLIEG